MPQHRGMSSMSWKYVYRAKEEVLFTVDGEELVCCRSENALDQSQSC